MAKKHGKLLLFLSIATGLLFLLATTELTGSLSAKSSSSAQAPYSPWTAADQQEDTRPGVLTPDVIRGIKKFVFFVGYARSGHSIVGSLMDAHPHVVIAHEFFLFKKLDMLDRVANNSWRENLFQSLYNNNSRSKIRSRSYKGYILEVEGLWEGTYVDHIEVIGDKSGGMTTKQYRNNKQRFIKNFQKLKQSIRIPLRIIHVLRNPFDMISTNAIHIKKSSTFLKRLKENPGQVAVINTFELQSSIGHNV